MLVSDLYGKQIITTSGNRLGIVEDVIIDFENGAISRLLLTKYEMLAKAENTRDMMRRYSVNFARVKSISESIVVGTENKQSK